MGDPTRAANIDGNWTKWLPWLFQIAVLIWGAAMVTSQVRESSKATNELRAELRTIQTVVTSLQLRVAELSVELKYRRNEL